ncbi:hypothetical protein FCV25MIE_10259 [Fagus crenata]
MNSTSPIAQQSILSSFFIPPLLSTVHSLSFSLAPFSDPSIGSTKSVNQIYPTAHPSNHRIIPRHRLAHRDLLRRDRAFRILRRRRSWMRTSSDSRVSQSPRWSEFRWSWWSQSTMWVAVRGTG